jgi:hypothetical protein
MTERMYIDALAEAIREEFDRDERVFMIGEDIGVYGGSSASQRGCTKNTEINWWIRPYPKRASWASV